VRGEKERETKRARVEKRGGGMCAGKGGGEKDEKRARACACARALARAHTHKHLRLNDAPLESLGTNLYYDFPRAENHSHIC